MTPAQRLEKDIAVDLTAALNCAIGRDHEGSAVFKRFVLEKVAQLVKLADKKGPQ